MLSSKMSQPVKTMSFRSASGTKSLISGVRVVGALAEADGAHLGQRADRLGESVADRFHAGDQRGGHGAHADNHDSQFSLCGLNIRSLRCSHSYGSVLSSEIMRVRKHSSVASMEGLWQTGGTQLGESAGQMRAGSARRDQASLRPHAVLPVGPDKPDDGRQQQHDDDRCGSDERPP